MIPSKRLVKNKSWREFLKVMERVHQKNRRISEDQVTRDVLKAIAELRKEGYTK